MTIDLHELHCPRSLGQAAKNSLIAMTELGQYFCCPALGCIPPTMSDYARRFLAFSSGVSDKITEILYVISILRDIPAIHGDPAS
ncbi:hypothetical protein [Tardiphaga sp.]|jgi:hypothetical protein|uniref:hypothetical protein n=1 Tax=Tardiphaga sp. TaxID=1926292 RepID=UPI002631C636|nr:hypothetical protein [Tardiphaga sp.]